MNYNKKILFVHIPKTGGTSISSKINQNMWKKSSAYMGHDPLFLLEKDNDVDDIFSFCIVRNPYKRTYSYFHHFKKINDLDCPFFEFLTIIKRKKFFKNTPMVLFPQSFYVYNSKGEIGIDKIYKYEKFYEIERDFDLKFEKINVGNYQKKDYIDDYKCQKCIDLVRELFSVDFSNFNYDLKNYE
jgi:hypothetical protein